MGEFRTSGYTGLRMPGHVGSHPGRPGDVEIALKEVPGFYTIRDEKLQVSKANSHYWKISGAF
jgi:hypothetical protein